LVGAILHGMQRRPTPTQQEDIEDLLTRSKRRELPIRWSFVQRGSRRRPEPGPLAKFVGHHDERGLDLYLLVHAVASAAPWNVDLPAGVWARMLGLLGDDGPSAVSKTWRRLEDQRLITRERVRRRASITLLREDGTGDPYTHPGSKSGRTPYLKLPYAYWEDGWYQKLRLPGKVMLLIALSLEDDFILPEDKAKPWYGISPDFAGDGLRALKKLEVLATKIDYRKAPLTVTGWTEERSYTLQPPFGPRGRSRQTGKPQPGGTTIPGPAGEETRSAQVVKLRRPRKRPQSGQAS
jgi:hypothetical protein